MKRLIPLLTAASLMLTGCYATRIVTVAPDTRYQGAYSTTVTVPRTSTVTTTTRVTALSEDISLCLDLQAIGAAFAQSSTVQDFENLINNSSYMLSNLDLNQDGYVDYLRVIETVQGGAHVFVIQAVLAPDVYQDVATLVAEVSHVASSCCVQIIGAPYIYGPAYIIQPVYVATPVIYAHLLRPYYAPWHSPWYWGHYPPCYRHPIHVYASHYHAYIDSYMRNHRYCHEFRYAPSCHYPAYEQVCRPVQRNDYSVAHPERSFSVRYPDVPANDNFGSSQGRAANARDLRESVNAATSSSRSATANSGGTRSTTATVPASGTGSRSTTSTSSSTGSRSTTATSSSSRSATSTTSSTTGSRSSTATAPASGTGSRSATSTSSSTGSRSTTSTSSRSSSATPSSSSSRTSATPSSSSSRSSSSSASRSSSQTTVRSNVRSSGSSNTRISTTSPSGSSSSTRRSAPAPSSSSSSSSRNASRR